MRGVLTLCSAALAVAVLALILAPPAAAQSALADRSVSDLIEELRNPNPAVRVEVMGELARRGDRKALVPLLGRLRDEDADARAYAAEALRILGDERAVPFLSRVLEDSDATVRCRAVLALGDLGGKYLLPVLERQLKDPAMVVRAAAVRALGEIGDPLSLKAVLRAQAEEPLDVDGAVSSAAMIAAAKLGGAEGFTKSLALAEPKLADSWFLRASAAHAVGVCGDRERVAFLTKLLREDSESRVCQAAAGSLAKLGAVDVLAGEITNESPFRRKAAVAGLASLAGKEARVALIEATRDKDASVVLEAGIALLALGEKDAFPLIIGLLSEEAPIWMGAMDALEFRSGQEFGRNPPRWREWFEEDGTTLAFDAETGLYR